ncbi:hypothetical protein A4R26_33435 [Niastella populi]|uniref:Uncharacterized protein n=1 Tax=Niastella populi TaxID=550983 RepID=A0A1V9GAL1_9BACT|nr:hypothetical protein A4R26_33435 [Niastella populi]
MADSYCKANDLDLNREINNGSGALDFKVSHGLAKVTVELKYSKNPKLIEGYEKQLRAYNRAEGVEDKHSIYLVLRVNSKQDRKIRQINKLIHERSSSGKQSPELIVINAVRMPPASKR